MATGILGLCVEATDSDWGRSCEVVNLVILYIGSHGNWNNRDSAQLIPYLFQFLVLLSREQPKLMSIPEVMQKCDQVLASGRNVSAYGKESCEQELS